MSPDFDSDEPSGLYGGIGKYCYNELLRIAWARHTRHNGRTVEEQAAYDAHIKLAGGPEALDHFMARETYIRALKAPFTNGEKCDVDAFCQWLMQTYGDELPPEYVKWMQFIRELPDL